MASVWDNEILVTRIRELWEFHSAAQIAWKLQDEFQVRVSRNSVVGKLFRLGLTVSDKKYVHPCTNNGVSRRSKGPRPPRPPRVTRAHIIPAGSGLRIIRTTFFERIPALRCAEVDPLHISFADLEPHHCRYPFGDNPVLTYCGHIKRDGSSYCEAHHQLCHGVGTTSERIATLGVAA